MSIGAGAGVGGTVTEPCAPAERVRLLHPRHVLPRWEETVVTTVTAPLYQHSRAGPRGSPSQSLARLMSTMAWEKHH